jgi:hypothetical protein
MRAVFPLIAFAIVAACTAAKSETDAELVKRAGAPLFSGIGEFHRVIDTKDPGARRYFDQGMMLAFGFNHAEAIRSFRAAQTLDPTCAMCFWGEALATGANINVTAKGKAIDHVEGRTGRGLCSAEKASSLAKGKPQAEQDLIKALATRYSPQPVDDRTALDTADAPALGELVKTYPADDDIAAIYGEALAHPLEPVQRDRSGFLRKMYVAPSPPWRTWAVAWPAMIGRRAGSPSQSWRRERSTPAPRRPLPVITSTQRAPPAASCTMKSMSSRWAVSCV